MVLVLVLAAYAYFVRQPGGRNRKPDTLGRCFHKNRMARFRKGGG